MIPYLVQELIKITVAEDAPYGDVTTESILHNSVEKKLIIKSEEKGIFCGEIIISPLMKEIDPSLKITSYVRDGETFNKDSIILILTGDAKSLMIIERPLLNFISKLSGIATGVEKFKKTLPASIKIIDTRKTTPGWRFLEKYAVKVGGGNNHRFGLSDGILIKDNHKIIAGGVKEAIKFVREKNHHLLKVEVEVDNLKEYREALEEKPDLILLDNFTPEMIREAVKEKPPGILIEVSGGITPENISQYVIEGVDFISSGFLTYGANWMKFTAEIE